MKNLTTITLTLLALTTAAAAGDAGKGAPATPPAAAEVPKPPQELADAAKMMAGTWKCSGQVFMDMKDPTKGTDVTATITHKLDLNNWWIHSNLAGTGKFTFKFDAFVTYDATAKKWYRIGVDNMGSSRNEWSTGPKDNKLMWEGDSRSVMGVAKVRETEEMSKDGSHVTGEMSIDGKTWLKTHDVTCKK